MYIKNRWLILAIVTSTLFLIIIDMTVLYTALPDLSQALNVTASEKLWIINTYPLMVASLLPGAGMLSDRIGHKTLFMAGLPTFGIASLCAAYSPSAEYLIASRALLAVGATMMMPATLAIVRHVFTDAHERSIAIGIWSAVASGAAALGPVLGGLLLEYFWWGSVFLLNVPVIMAIFPCARMLIPQGKCNPQRPCDLIGSLFIMLGLIGVIYALKELSKANQSRPALLMALAIGSLFLALFVRRQKRAIQPMLDFSLFRNQPFTSAVVIAVISMMALTGIELVLTQRLQLVLGLSPLMAGLTILPLPVASALAAPLAGMILPRYGSARLLSGGLILTMLGIIALSLLFKGDLLPQLFALFLIGFGLGGTFTAVSASIMLNTPEENAGMIAAIEDVSWEMGGVLGVTLLGGLMTAFYSRILILPESLSNRLSVYDSLDEALRVARRLDSYHSGLLIELANKAFDQAVMCVLMASAILITVSIVALKRVLRKQRPLT